MGEKENIFHKNQEVLNQREKCCCQVDPQRVYSSNYIKISIYKYRNQIQKNSFFQSTYKF